MTLARARSVAVEQAAAATTPTASISDRDRTLLIGGLLAGPVYLVLFVAQALTRDGFDLLRHPASLLSTGELGWIQITNFLLTGALVVAAAAGLRSAARTGRARVWTGRFVATFGLGMMAAGIFAADPADGFPVGTPLGRPAEVSWHGTVHFVVAAIAFLAISLACLSSVRPLARSGQRGLAAYAATTGALFLVTFAGMATGQTSPVFTVGLLCAVVLVFGWLAAISVRLRAGGRII